MNAQRSNKIWQKPTVLKGKKSEFIKDLEGKHRKAIKMIAGLANLSW